MAKLTVEDTSLQQIADAIRGKTGTSEKLIFPDNFITQISSIKDGIKIGGFPEPQEPGKKIGDLSIGARIGENTLDQAGNRKNTPIKNIKPITGGIYGVNKFPGPGESKKTLTFSERIGSKTLSIEMVPGQMGQNGQIIITYEEKKIIYQNNRYAPTNFTYMSGEQIDFNGYLYYSSGPIEDFDGIILTDLEEYSGLFRWEGNRWNCIAIPQ